MTATDLDPAALLDALHAALDADPSDAATRQALADLLEDAGDPAGARGQRWQAKHGKWPAKSDNEWRWWSQSHSARRDPDDLPDDVFMALPGRDLSNICRYYPSRRAAEADLAQALETLASREARAAACDDCGKRWTA
jgi:hypothetical protein